MPEFQMTEICLKLCPIWQFIGYALSAENPHAELSGAWRDMLVKHAKAAEQLMNEVFNEQN